MTALFALALASAQNVVFVGAAGPNRLAVTIDPPEVVPGLASIEVQTDGDLDRLQLLALPLGSEEAAYPPVPDEAVRSPTDPHHFAGTLWLMSRGSWQVRLLAQGAKGSGELSVPVGAVALQVKSMPRPLGGMLFAFMLILALGLISIVAAAVREGQLPPGTAPDARRLKRSQAARWVATIAVGGALIFGRRWWRAEDAFQTTRLYRPAPLDWRAEPGKLVLTLPERSGESLEGRRGSAHPFGTGTDLAAPPEVRLIRTGDDGRAWRLPATQIAPGQYAVPLAGVGPAGHFLLAADVVHASGFAETLTTTLDLAGLAAPVPPIPSSAAPSIGIVPTQFRAPRELAWIKTDRPIPIGAPLEAIVTRADDPTFYARLRPSGTANAASEAIANPAPRPPAGGEVIGFPYVFPSAGHYRIFLTDPDGHGSGGVDVEVQAPAVG